tara:strand:- start:6575 stop:7291 length:717 start_codon:yes stop_codon:yes gene_type:complete
MDLIVDIGNSQIKTTFFNNSVIFKKESFDSSDYKSIFNIINSHTFNKIFVSSLRIQSKFKDMYHNKKIFYFNNELDIPLKINYKNIHNLGKDRIAAMVGANKLFPKKNLLVIDIGTCITLDVLSKDREFLGGRISPGLKMRYQSIASVESLPLLKYTYDKNIFGNDTKSSIHTGVQRSIISEINDFSNQLKKQFNNFVVIITGGDMSLLLKEQKNTIFVFEENLVAIGLNEILSCNFK